MTSPFSLRPKWGDPAGWVGGVPGLSEVGLYGVAISLGDFCERSENGRLGIGVQGWEGPAEFEISLKIGIIFCQKKKHF